jgi:hypothetical protein
MTLSEIRALARKKLGETTSAFWTDAEINTYINLGCKDIAQRTKCLRSNTTIDSVSCVANTAAAASHEYTISENISNFFAITELAFFQNGVDWCKLIPTSREELDATRKGWRTNVGYTYTSGTATTYNYNDNSSTPMLYYWDREEDVLGIEPPPDDDNEGTGYIKAYYSYNHTDISGDSSSPTIPVALHLAVVDYAVHTGFDTRGWGDKANDAFTKYLARINDYMTERRREREDEEIIMKNYRNI